MAKRITDEDLRLNLIINGDGGRKQLLELERQINNTTTAIEETRKKMTAFEVAGKKASQEYQDLSKSLEVQQASLKKCQSEFKSLQETVPLTSKTMKELKHQITATRTALERAVPGSDNWNQLNKALQELVVNCFQILYIRSLNTIAGQIFHLLFQGIHLCPAAVPVDNDIQSKVLCSESIRFSHKTR